MNKALQLRCNERVAGVNQEYIDQDITIRLNTFLAISLEKYRVGTMLRKFRIISDEKLQIVRAKPTVKGVDASPAAKQQIAEDKALRISTAMTLRL